MKLRDLRFVVEAGQPVRLVDDDIMNACGAVKYQGAYFVIDENGLSEFSTFDTLCRYMGADGLSEWDQPRALPPDMASELLRVHHILPTLAPPGTPDELALLITAIRMNWPPDDDQAAASSASSAGDLAIDF